MIRHALLGGLVALAGACQDRAAAPVAQKPPASVRTAAPPAPPVLAVPAAIEGLADVPAEAHARLVATVNAIETNDRMQFVEMVSSGGFAVAPLALDVQQVAAELEGRTIAELTTLTCAPGACRWRVAMVDAKHVAITASLDGRELGNVELMHDDDGSWGLLRATQRQPDPTAM